MKSVKRLTTTPQGPSAHQCSRDSEKLSDRLTFKSFAKLTSPCAQRHLLILPEHTFNKANWENWNLIYNLSLVRESVSDNRMGENLIEKTDPLILQNEDD